MLSCPPVQSAYVVLLTGRSSSFAYASRPVLLRTSASSPGWPWT